MQLFFHVTLILTPAPPIHKNHAVFKPYLQLMPSTRRMRALYPMTNPNSYSGAHLTQPFEISFLIDLQATFETLV